MTTPLCGVNLGGWLILEKWMTPSLFEGTDAVDEYTFMQTKGAADKIEKHRRTFITEKDFAWIADQGLTAVRIPVGYWLFEKDQPYTPTITYLDWAVKMAKKYDLKVLVDLHGAPGSQNGQDHSGRTGKALWYKDAANREKTIEVLARIAEYYKDESMVWGVELLNEPKPGVVQWKLRRFYRQAYRRITEVGRPGLRVVFHDAFTPRLLTGALRPKASFPVVMDVHWYHFLDWFYKLRSVESYFRKLQRRSRLIRRLQRRQPVIIGEWSLVIASKTLKKYPEADADEYTKRHADLLLDAYDTAAGWFYWSYKTEHPGIWHFRSLVETGMIRLKR